MTRARDLARFGSQTAMTFTSNNDVGIGTTNPATKFEVDGTITADNIAAGSIGFSSASTLLVTGISTFNGIASFTSDVSIAGTLTYEDVTNIDSIGLITARSGIHVGTGTSIFSPSDNVLTFGTNNDERVRIDSTGKMGVGVSPTLYPGKFVVGGDGTVCEHEFNSRVSSSLTNDSRGFMQVTDGSEQLHIYSPNGGDNVWEVQGTERLRILSSSGNIGFGTSNPGAKFDVLIPSTSTNYYPDDYNEDWAAKFINEVDARTSGGVLIANRFRSPNSTALKVGSLFNGTPEFDPFLIVDGGGKVGVGTTRPTEDFHIYNSTPIIRLEDNVSGRLDLQQNASEATYTSFDGNGGAGIHKFFCGTGTTEAIHITSSRTVGINTTNPSTVYPLTIGTETLGQTQNNSSRAFLYASRSLNQNFVKGYWIRTKLISADTQNDWTSAPFRLQHQVDATNQGFVSFNEKSHATAGSGSNLSVSLGHNQTPYINLDSTGNVGIRTTRTNLAIVDVYGVNGGGQGGSLAIRNTASQLNSHVALYLCPNNGGGQDLQRSAAIKSHQAILGNYADLRFLVANSNTPAERMRIDPVGDIIFGGAGNTVSGIQGGTQTGFAILESTIMRQGSTTTSARTAISFSNPNGFVGQIFTSGSATSYVTSSDYRLKENVTPMQNAIAKLNLLQPKTFNFIANPDQMIDGFLAHEVQEIIPNSVSGEKDGEEMQGLDHSKLVPLLTGALQEAVAKIESLESELSAIKSHLNI